MVLFTYFGFCKSYLGWRSRCYVSFSGWSIFALADASDCPKTCFGCASVLRSTRSGCSSGSLASCYGWSSVCYNGSHGASSGYDGTSHGRSLAYASRRSRCYGWSRRICFQNGSLERSKGSGSSMRIVSFFVWPTTCSGCGLGWPTQRLRCSSS